MNIFKFKFFLILNIFETIKKQQPGKHILW